MNIKKQILICDGCGIKPATLHCLQCLKNYCYNCDKTVHLSQEMVHHKREVISYSKIQKNTQNVIDKDDYEENQKQTSNLNHRYTSKYKARKDRSPEPRRFDTVDMEYLDYQNDLQKPTGYEPVMNQASVVNQIQKMVESFQNIVQTNDSKHLEQIGDIKKQLLCLQTGPELNNNQLNNSGASKSYSKMVNNRVIDNDLSYKSLYMMEKEKTEQLEQQILQMKQQYEQQIDKLQGQNQKLQNKVEEIDQVVQNDYHESQMKLRNEQIGKLKRDKNMLEQQIKDITQDFREQNNQQELLIQNLRNGIQNNHNETQKFESLIHNFKECIDSFNTEKLLIMDENQKLAQELDECRQRLVYQSEPTE